MKQKGFTLIELIIVLVIASILFGITLFSFTTYKKSQELSRDTDLIVETLREARNLTIVSKNAAAYGVHFDDNAVVLYVGPTYSSSAGTNKVYGLSEAITLTKNIPGGGSEILFNRISGETNLSGTATVRLAVGENASTTITIYKTGTVEHE